MKLDKVQDGSARAKQINVGLTITLLRVIIGVAMCVAVPAFSVSAPYSYAIFAAAGLFVGVELLIAGVVSFIHEEYFNTNTALLIVFVVSFIIGVGYEGAIILIIAQCGYLLTDYVRKVIKEHILSLTGLDFKIAHVLRGELLVDNYLEEVMVGDEIIVRAGEYFPVDCVVIEGNSTAKATLLDVKCDEFALNIGDKVLAGTMNIGADVKCEVISEGTSTASDILSVLQRNEVSEMPHHLRNFEAAMCILAVVMGVMLVLLTDVDAYEAVHRGLAVIALSGAVPIYGGFADIRFAARAGAAARGAVFADGEVFKRVGACDCAVICADGILTEGKLHVSAAYSESLDEDTFLRIAAHAMAFAVDPAAEAILNAYEGDIVFEDIQDFREIPNCGVMVVYKNVPVVLGTQALMANVKGLLPKKMSADRQIMFMLVGKQYAGYIVLNDPISDFVDEVSERMQELGNKKLVFVTSYSDETACKISERSGITEYRSGFSCDERMQYVEQLRNETEGKMAYYYHEKYAAEERSAADYDVCVGCSLSDLIDGRCDVVSTMGRVSAIFEGLQTVRLAHSMSVSTAYAMLAVKLILIVFAGAGIASVWFVATFELIASLLVKVLSVGAFDEQTLNRYRKKKKA